MSDERGKPYVKGPSVSEFQGMKRNVTMGLGR